MPRQLLSLFLSLIVCSLGQCQDQDPVIQDMLRFLIKLPEHTWGAHDFIDNVNWTNAELAVARQSEGQT